MEREEKKRQMLSYMEHKYGENFVFVEDYAGQAGAEYIMILVKSCRQEDGQALVRLSFRDGTACYEDNYIAYLLKQEIEEIESYFAHECIGECKIFYKIPEFVFPESYSVSMTAGEFLSNPRSMPQLYIYPKENIPIGENISAGVTIPTGENISAGVTIPTGENISAGKSMFMKESMFTEENKFMDENGSPEKNRHEKEKWEEKIRDFCRLNAEKGYCIRGTLCLSASEADYEKITKDNFAAAEYGDYHLQRKLFFSMGEDFSERGVFHYMRWYQPEKRAGKPLVSSQGQKKITDGEKK